MRDTQQLFSIVRKTASFITLLSALADFGFGEWHEDQAHVMPNGTGWDRNLN